MSTLPMARLRVGVHHGSPLVNAGLIQLLLKRPDLSVLDAAEALRADVLITDHPTAVALLSAQSRGGQRTPPLLVLSPTQREREVRQALELGVQGYLTLGCAPDEILDAVRAVGRGLRWLGAEAAARMADSMAQALLTPREEQVLRLLVAGCSNKLIGQRLNLALGTVKTHVKAILQKLEARSRTEAISICLQRGLLSPEREATAPGRPTEPAAAAPAQTADPASRSLR